MNAFAYMKKLICICVDIHPLIYIHLLRPDADKYFLHIIIYFWSCERIANLHTYMYTNVSFPLLSSIIGIENKIFFVKSKKKTLIIHFRTNTTLRIKVLAHCFYKKEIYSALIMHKYRYILIQGVSENMQQLLLFIFSRTFKKSWQIIYQMKQCRFKIYLQVIQLCQ